MEKNHHYRLFLGDVQNATLLLACRPTSEDKRKMLDVVVMFIHDLVIRKLQVRTQQRIEIIEECW
jgi:hypothetical protein